jgi:RHS repeat-associated protein
MIALSGTRWAHVKSLKSHREEILENLSEGRARHYDPETGRWTSKDPILFGYVMGDPINEIDPSGLAGEGFGGSSRFQIPVRGTAYYSSI